MKIQNRTIITFIILFLIAPIFAFAQDSSTNTDTQVLPARPEQRPGEPSADFTSRLRAWQAEVNRIAEGAPRIPRPAQRPRESAADYTARLRAWEAEVRRISETNPRTSTSTTTADISEQPWRRPGESEADYNARFEAAVKERVSQISKREQQLQREYEQVARQRSSLGISNPGSANSDNMLIIPTGEIQTEELLSINEDMNVMTQIFRNELSSEAMSGLGNLPLIGSIFFEPTQSNRFLTNRNNAITNMYLQGYGALFFMNVDFPLSAAQERQEQPQEPNEGEVDQVWQQTRQQIYEPQVAASTGRRAPTAQTPQVQYDAQKVDNLKITLITALKHAANIRALKPGESVILRITGTSSSESKILSQLGDSYLVRIGDTQQWIQSGELPNDFEISSPTVLIIRAKKSDIDAYAKGELNLDEFRETVEVFSYPLISGNFAN